MKVYPAESYNKSFVEPTKELLIEKINEHIEENDIAHWRPMDRIVDWSNSIMKGEMYEVDIIFTPRCDIVVNDDGTAALK